MPTFVYKAKNSQGRTVKDRIIAVNSEDAILKLRTSYPLITSLEEEKQTAASSFFKKKAKKIKIEQLAQFSRELATMVGTGTPLVKSLAILSRQFKEKTVSRIARDLSADIEAGNSFADGLRRFPAVFSPLYVNMVAAGETSGMLNKILERLAIYLEKTALLLRKIQTAMIYPVAVIIVALSITSVLVLKVIPGFKTIFDSLGGQLPLATRIVVGISEVSRRYLPYILGIIIFLGVILGRYIRTPGGRLTFDTLKLRLPILGSLFQKVAIARFTRTLATLLNGGVPILEALNIVSKTAGNAVLENAILRAKEEVRRGQRLAVELEKNDCFPPMVVEMIGIGEETGELDNMLDKVAQSYEDQVDVAAAGLVSLVEPFIIIFLGVVVGGIVIAMFLPILKITQLLGR